MRLGVQLPEVEREVRWPEIARMAVAADEVGFDSLWIGDHHLYRDEKRAERGPWEAWTQLSALAAITQHVQLGPLVAATAFHPAGMIARMAASIDDVSGGRFVLGLGAGWNEVEFRAFGFPFDHLVTRFEESFEIIRRLLAGETVSFEGLYHRVDEAVLLPKPGRSVPLMVGSMGPRMLGITLPHVEWWNGWYSWYGNTPDGFRELNAKIDSACQEARRPPGEVKRSICVLATTGAGDGATRTHDAPPVTLDRLPEHLHELERLAADEAILILDPIDEASIREVGGVLAATR